MLIKTRFFGEIDLEESKIVTFESGLMGFEEYKQYTLLFDNEKEERPAISWLQSVEEPGLALPVISPLFLKPDYNPIVEDELLKCLGELNDENLVILNTMTIPKDLEKMTANLKAPIIINASTRMGRQVIVENPDYEVKFNAYNALKGNKKGDE